MMCNKSKINRSNWNIVCINIKLDLLDESLSVVKCLLDLVHSRLNVKAQQLLEPAKNLGLHLGAVPRCDLASTAIYVTA